jgi:hypothetical protein
LGRGADRGRGATVKSAPKTERQGLTAEEREIVRLSQELAAWRTWSDHYAAWALCNSERPPDDEIRAGLGDLLDIATGEEVARLRSELADALVKLELLDDHRRADSQLIDRLTLELQVERGQKKADLLQGLAELTVALRDLIASVTAAKCQDTIVLRDLEAARELIGEDRS